MNKKCQSHLNTLPVTSITILIAQPKMKLKLNVKTTLKKTNFMSVLNLLIICSFIIIIFYYYYLLLPLLLHDIFCLSSTYIIQRDSLKLWERISETVLCYKF